MTHAAAPDTASPAAGVLTRPLSERLALAAILLLAAFLRFYALDASSLWNDEGTTWALLSRSFAHVARDAAADIHPPAYYWLLKAWTAAAGRDAWAMRSLSALLGVLLVLVVYRIGLHLPRRSRLHASALLAALLAALDPFQVYYGQEARMYMLLALEGAVLFWALLALDARQRSGRGDLPPLLGYAFAGAAGLWTHYSFPILLAAAGAAYVWNLLADRSVTPGAPSPARRFTRFAAANLVIVLLFLPWLPTAVMRVLNWPKGGEETTLLAGLRLTLHMFIAGPIRSAPGLAWPWLALGAALSLVGLWALHPSPAPVLGLWLAAPVALMFGLGLFSDAFLQVPAGRVPGLAAADPRLRRSVSRARSCSALAAAIALLATLSAALTLPGYYGDPTARDNYAGVARYLGVLGDPAADVVVLNAPANRTSGPITTPACPSAHPGTAPARPRTDRRPAHRGHARPPPGLRPLLGYGRIRPGRHRRRLARPQRLQGSGKLAGQPALRRLHAARATRLPQAGPPPAFGPDIALDQVCQPETPQQASPGEAATVSLHWHNGAGLRLTKSAYSCSTRTTRSSPSTTGCPRAASPHGRMAGRRNRRR